MDENTQKSAIVNQQSLINIAVIGSGTMGSGIAQVAATAGCIVKLFDLNQKNSNSSLNDKTIIDLNELKHILNNFMINTV